MTRSRPLAGLTVLDLSQGIAGPSCGGLFSEYGARVIKVEPTHGDWMRPLGAGHDDMSASFLYYNRGKESLSLDIKAPGAVDTILKLAARADVLIENNRPGVSDRLGFGYDAIRAVQPKIIYLSVSGLGQTGPDAKAPLTDTVAQARSGMMMINRGRTGVPSRLDTTIIDAITGLYAFQSATMALWPGRETREAQHLDVSLLQSAAAIQGPKVMEYGILGETVEKLNAPAGSFPASDGWFAISLLRETNWQTICTIIDRPDLCQGRYATFADRAKVVGELTEILDEIFKTNTTAHWVETMRAEGILITAINDYGSWLEDAQTKATLAAPFINVTTHDTAPVARTPGQPNNDQLSPKLGQHSRLILAEIGLGDDAIDTLVEAGTVVTAEATA
jgi:crotonobetainyl-CoA:carnitine CoA-transferase CaiB-like acyl-CoA transferase